MTIEEILNLFSVKYTEIVHILKGKNDIKERISILNQYDDIFEEILEWLFENASAEICFEVMDTIKSIAVKEVFALKRIREFHPEKRIASVFTLSSERDLMYLFERQPSTVVYNLYHKRNHDIYCVISACVENKVIYKSYKITDDNSRVQVHDFLLYYNNCLNQTRNDYLDASILEKVIIEIGYMFGSFIIHSLGLLLREINNEGKIERLIIIPDKDLFTIPFNTCFSEINSRRVYVDEIVNEIIFGTSVHCLRLSCLKRNLNSKLANIVMAIDNKKLPNHGQVELKYYSTISSKFEEAGHKISSITHNDEVLNALTDANYIFWGSHASCDPTNGLNSSLFFQERSFTFQDIAENWNLQKNYCAILSACETGISFNHKSRTGIYSGIDYAMMIAGAKVVLSTFWKIPDVLGSYYYLMFFETLFRGVEDSPERACCKIQYYLRTGIWKMIIGKNMEEIKNNSSDDKLIDVLEYFYSLPDDIFSSPYYWGGFKCFGLSDYIPLDL